MRAVTLNHGGVITRLREAVASAKGLSRQATQPDVLDAAALMWQADGRLHSTMKTLAGDNDVVLIQEHHIRSGDTDLRDQMTALLTTGEYDRWRVIFSPAMEDDAYAGVLIWYNTDAVEVQTLRAEKQGGQEAAEAVMGRLQRAKAVSYTHLTLPTSDLV